MKNSETYVAFLRGINVGGHHKVPMADLKKELQKLELENIVTLLNSGNIIFDSTNESLLNLEKKVSEHLEKSFGFSIPTIIRKSEMIYELLSNNLFKDVKLTKDIRLYVSFLRKNDNTKLKLPWKSSDNSYIITGKSGETIFSVLDLSVSGTPKAMEVMEKTFGKDITTRNWNTIERIGKKLEANS
jgi:uncharacterized protein (DUF1697 family)